MRIVYAIVWFLMLWLVVSFAWGVRKAAAQGRGTTMGTVNTGMLFLVQVVLVAALGLNPLHFLWMAPLAFVLGTASMVRPFSLLSVLGRPYANLCCAGLGVSDASPAKVRQGIATDVPTNRMTPDHVAQTPQTARGPTLTTNDTSPQAVPFSESLPDIAKCQPVRMYRMGTFVAMVVRSPQSFAEAKGSSIDVIEYVYAMAVSTLTPPHLPILIVTAERSGEALRKMLQDVAGQPQTLDPFLCIFDIQGGHKNLGSHPDLVDLDVFSDRALSVAKDLLQVKDAPVRL